MIIRGEQNHDIAEVPTGLRVVKIDAHSDPRWEAFVKTRPESLIYHHPAWLQLLEEAFGYKSVNLACEDVRGQLRGILPLYYKRGLLTGRQFSSLPRTPMGGPLVCDDQSMILLVREALERTRSEQDAQLQIKTFSNALDGLVKDVIGVPWRETYVLELPERPELLHMGNFQSHPQVKRAVNKAAKSGVQVSQAESEQDLRDWYQLYLNTMRTVVVPPRPYHFFEIAWRRLQPLGMMRLLLAKQYQAGRSRLLAGLLLLMYGQTVIYAFSGWRREDQALRPNDALHWQAIQDACAEGFRYYDFGEVSKNNQGLAEFKSKWGAEAHWLYRYYYPAPREMEISMLESSSSLHQLANGVWQRLPLRATALLSQLAHHYF